MRRLRFPRPETILRRLNREIRALEREHSAAARAARSDGSFLAAGSLRSKLVALQSFREKAFGIPLRPYNANRNLFPRKECRS